MRPITVNGFFILVLVTKCHASSNIGNALSNITSRPLANLATDSKDFIEIAAERGHRAETHRVVTEDGYVLTMFRIPAGATCAKRAPVLCMHGLLQTAEGFIDAGPAAPGLVLAADCYDVWFGNVRGNHHSRKHVRLDPDRDLDYWKFSVDEIGSYDIPAMIDRVLDATGAGKLIYVGYSQGGGTFFIMNSERPEYADKVSLFIGLAPATRQYYTKSAAFRSLCGAIKTYRGPLEAAGVWEILSKGFPIQGSLSILCQVELLAAVFCGSAVALVDSPHPGSITPEGEKRIFENFPSGTSTQNMARYGQAMRSLKFIKFDYGSEGNRKVYGSGSPPEYDLSASRMPVVIFHGSSDRLVDARDVEWTVRRLPQVLEYVTVEDPEWNHFDMTYSRYWNHTIYVTMKKYLNIYDSIY